VPALTFGVSTNFALAKFLASRSFGNVLVALTRFRFPRGSSNETYHVPLDLLAMIPSRGLRRRLTDRGRDLNRRLTKSFRSPPVGPQGLFCARGLCRGQPSEPACCLCRCLVCNGRTTTSAARHRTGDPCKVSSNLEKHTVAPVATLVAAATSAFGSMVAAIASLAALHFK
jgi:hypothetical protein